MDYTVIPFDYIQETIPTEQPIPKPRAGNTSPPMQKVGGTIIIINTRYINYYNNNDSHCYCHLIPRNSLIGYMGSSFFIGKVTALGVLCCFALFVCLTLLASFFLPSHLSFKNMYTIHT